MKKLKAGIIALSLFGTGLSAQVVAVVDGQNVTSGEINQFLQAMTGKKDFTLDKVPSAQRKAVVKDYVTKYKILYPLAKSVENSATYRVLAKNLAISIWARKQAQNIRLTEGEIKKFYNENKERFKTKEGKYIPYEQVKPFIKQLLSGQKAGEQIRQILQKHKITYKIQ